MQSGAYLDVAQVTLYVFWIFFACLIYYLRREDKREGYPLDSTAIGGGVVHGFPRMPDPKTYLLRDGHTATLPNHKNDRRDVAVAPIAPWPGAPVEPTGNPMLDGVGPGSWADREDVPELNIDNIPCIVPLRLAEGTYLEARDPDPRGMQVIGADSETGGVVTDVWVDRAEALIRYLEVEVAPADGRWREGACCCRCRSPRSTAGAAGSGSTPSSAVSSPTCRRPRARSGHQARGRPDRRLLRRRHALRHARATGAAAVKQDFNQFKELPAPLPVGERVIWQGKPSFKGLALRSFHIREVAIYFGLLLMWRLWSNWSHGVPARRGDHFGAVADRSGDQRHRGAGRPRVAVPPRGLLHHHQQAGPVSVRRGAADDHEHPAGQDRQRGPEDLSRRHRAIFRCGSTTASACRICCCGRISGRGGCACRSRC